MNRSTANSPLARLLGALTERARTRGLTDSAWAAAAGLPKETLSRLRRRSSCDLSTLLALAKAVDASVHITDREVAEGRPSGHFPAAVDRDYEERLVELCASGNLDAVRWLSCGSPFFMAGLAVMQASERDVDRRGLLDLAERLHPGATEPAAFTRWLDASPVRPSRFLPLVRERTKHAA